MQDQRSVGDVALGMFIVGIDRPWHETPFPSTGFLVTDDRQLVQLATLCRVVRIDAVRSLGTHHRAPHAAREVDTGAASTRTERPTPTARAETARFLDLLRSARGLPARPEATSAHLVRPTVGPPAEPADHASAAAGRELDAASASAVAAIDVVRGGGPLDLRTLASAIERMARVLAQRPDPLQWVAAHRVTHPCVREHAVEVAQHLLVFARHLGLEPATTLRLGLAGLVQDLGKLRLPRDLFRRSPRAEQATASDVEAFRQHVRHSLDLLAEARVDDAELIATVARHHERIDGRGYPEGRAGDAVGMHAEMAGMVDAYCTLVHPRRPGRTLTGQQALERIDGMRGTHFTPSLVDQFLHCIGLHAVGTLVELNTGEIAVVVEQNRVRRTKPTIMVLLAADRAVRRDPVTLDLDAYPRTANGLPYAIAGALSSAADVIDPREFYLA